MALWHVCAVSAHECPRASDGRCAEWSLSGPLSGRQQCRVIRFPSSYTLQHKSAVLNVGYWKLCRCTPHMLRSITFCVMGLCCPFELCCPCELHGCGLSFVTPARLQGEACRSENMYWLFTCAECLGVGLVRIFDAAAGLIHILTPLPLDALRTVNLLQVLSWAVPLPYFMHQLACAVRNRWTNTTHHEKCIFSADARCVLGLENSCDDVSMQVGRLDLPPELLQSGSIVCPYLSSWSISTVGTGAGAIKSRNNLQRAGQVA